MGLFYNKNGNGKQKKKSNHIHKAGKMTEEIPAL